jgi:hypothetical protein
LSSENNSSRANPGFLSTSSRYSLEPSIRTAGEALGLDATAFLTFTDFEEFHNSNKTSSEVLGSKANLNPSELREGAISASPLAIRHEFEENAIPELPRALLAAAVLHCVH